MLKKTPAEKVMHPKLAEFIEAGGEICTPKPEHSLAISKFLNARVADESYQNAPYLSAMLITFMSAASAVALDKDKNVVGIFNNMYRANDSALVPLSIETVDEDHGFLREGLIQHVEEESTKQYGAKVIVERPHILESFKDCFKKLSFIPTKDTVLDVANDNKTETDPDSKKKPTYRKPTIADAEKMMAIVKETNAKDPHGGLDEYSLEIYQIMCTEFVDTCLVSEIGGEVVGFTTGFLLPNKKEPELFIWQLGVGTEYHGNGIAPNMLKALVKTTEAKSFVTTIEGDNMASQRAFQKLADSMGISFRMTDEVINTKMLSDLDDPHPHDPEYIFAGRKLELVF